MANWDWQVFCKDNLEQTVVAGCMGKDGSITYLDMLLSAWKWTLAVSFSALIVALVVGTLVGIMRTLPGRGWRWLGNAWTELFRNIPLLVQLFLWYSVLPVLFPPLQALPTFWLVVMGLGFFTSARIAEQVKAGVESLSKGQRYAGLALGLSLGQTYRYVLLPMAFRIIIPPLTSESMNIIKNSAAAFAVSIAELTQYAMQTQEETARGVEVYLVVTGLYVITALAVNQVARFIEARLRVPGMIGAAR